MTSSREFHPLANMFPLLLGAEFTTLAADIKQHGLREPIVRYEGMILDGRNRYRACLRAGVEPRYQEIEFADRAAAVAYVISANIHRRHLTRGQKHDLVAKLLKADPTQSDRQIAETVKFSPTTVGKDRERLEETRDVSKVDTRVDRDGRLQPAHKSEKKTPVAGKPAAPAADLAPANTSEPGGDARPPDPAPSATEQPSTPPPAKPQDVGPYSRGETDRLRGRCDELCGEKRLLEIKVTGLETAFQEVNELLKEALAVTDNNFRALAGYDNKADAKLRKDVFSPGLFRYWQLHLGDGDQPPPPDKPNVRDALKEVAADMATGITGHSPKAPNKPAEKSTNAATKDLPIPDFMRRH